IWPAPECVRLARFTSAVIPRSLRQKRTLSAVVLLYLAGARVRQAGTFHERGNPALAAPKADVVRRRA
ncbi:hypothetical protein CJ430_31985, partial [Klebsiella pneumoniae]